MSSAYMAINLTYYFSTLLSNRWVVATSSIFVLRLGMVAFYYFPNSFQQYSPFAYINISDVLSGESAITHNYQHFNWITGVSLQFILSMILNRLTFLHVRKRVN